MTTAAEVRQTIYLRDGFRTHELKCRPEFFTALKDGRKTFEIRRDDRGYRERDVLLLCEWDPSTRFFTGRQLRFRVVYITDYGQVPGWVVMGLVPFGRAPR